MMTSSQSDPSRVEKLKSFSKSQVDLLAYGFQFPEGPVTDRHHQVYVCDVFGHCIYKVNPQTLVKEKWISFDGQPNGATWALDRENLLVVDSLQKRIVTIGRNGILKVIFSSERLNGPNDITIDDDGVIYFTDPTWVKGYEKIPQYVFALHPDGVLHKYGPFNQPNGIKFRAGLLYLAEGGTGRIYVARPPHIEFKVWATLQNQAGQNFKALDGLEVDAEGRVYVAVYDGGVVAVLNSLGCLLGHIDLPDSCPTNLEFDESESHLFITEAKGGRLFQVTPGINSRGESHFFNPPSRAL